VSYKELFEPFITPAAILFWVWAILWLLLGSLFFTFFFLFLSVGCFILGLVVNQNGPDERRHYVPPPPPDTRTKYQIEKEAQKRRKTFKEVK